MKNNNNIKATGSELTKNLDTGIVYITGAKGKGGGSAHTAVEANNTLRSAAVVKVIEVISEGPIVGVCGGARGILINNTPLMNADGTYNFPRIGWDYRVGLPSQDYMPGFASAAAEISVNAPLLLATPVVRTTTSVNIDSVKIAMQLPQGLSDQNTQNGDLNGSSVQFRVDTKLTASGTWTTYNTYTITGKTTSPYEAQYRIERPYGAGLWDIRVTRITADPGAAVKNQTTVARLTEIIDVKLGYNDTAVIGLAIDAESVGSSIPTRSYMVKGKIVSVPTNYTEANISGGTLGTTGTAYSGVWNGTFKQAWTQNPAWILYDLLTHPRYGMGEFISVNDIDIYSFYDAAVYNDTLVSDGSGGLESRFTFGGILTTQEDAGKVLQLVAGAFRSRLLQINGKWTILQDRPTSPVRNISNSNVQDGQFIYKSTGLFERHTAFNVTWNNRADRYLQKVSTVEDTVGIARYGYFPLDLAAYGATTEGQALRMAKWSLDTEQNQTETVTFKMGLNGFDLLPNDIVNLFDEDYTNVAGGGRIVSVVGTTVTLDKPVTLVSGSKISLTLADGITIEEKPIVQTSGTVSTFTVGSAFSTSVLQGADYIVITSISARQFKVLNLRFPSEMVVEVEALYHDPAKYGRVETGVSVPAEVFSNANAINNTVVVCPTALTFLEDAVRNADNTVTRHILASWTPSTLGSIASGYQVRYSRNGATSVLLDTPQTMVSIPVNADGVYSINVLAYDSTGRICGTSLTGDYTINSAASGILGAVANFYVRGTSALLWNTDDLTVSWEANGANLTPTQDYLVVVSTNGGAELRRELITDTKYTYTLAKNRADNLTLGGSPSATVKISVTPRDLFSRNGTTTLASFVNAVPDAVTGLSVFAGTQAATVQWESSSDTDTLGYLLWRGLTSTFSPGPGNLICEGMLNSFSEVNLADSTVYYYKVAAYDTFSRNLSGVGLNVSAAVSGTTSSGSSINEYELTGIIFTPNSPSTNNVAWSAGSAYKALGTGSGATWAISSGSVSWAGGVVYVYYKEGQTDLLTTTSITTAVAADQTIVATYRGGTNLEVGSGRAYIDGSLILAGTVAASQIVAGSLTATQFAATNLSGIFADLGTITAGNITLNSTGFIKSGQTAYATGTGLWLGSVSGVTKFSVGNTSQGFTWDGSVFTIKGALDAATGTFSGALDAATGTFSGALDAASGTFSGTLNAAAINAVNTINLAGNSVTVPTSAFSGGAVTLTTQNSWYNLLTLVLVSSGGQVFITASMDSLNTADAASDGSFQARLLCDGSVIATTSGAYADSTGTKKIGGSISIQFSHSPAAGTHTYQVQARRVRYSTGTVSQISMYIIETKR